MQFRKTAVLIVVGILGAGSMAACSVPEEEPANAAKVAKAQKKGKHRSDKAAEQPTQPTETVGQENARHSAESYLDTSAFSRPGLIKQLKFEGFSKADATYAVDYLSPNWNKQAAKSAKSYMDTSSFSASGLQDQLEFEGFTASQAAHGVAAAGY
jgi:Host cell surface-exposed lipoprotein